MPKLIIHHPDGETSKFELNKRLVSIGRGSDNDIVLPDGTSSSNHAMLKMTPEGDFAVTDLGSTNHTKVNGRKVQTAELLDGDKIHFGDTEVSYESDVSKGKGGTDRKELKGSPPPPTPRKLSAPQSFSAAEKQSGGAARPKKSRAHTDDDGVGAGGCFALLMLPMLLILCLFAGMEVRHYFSTDKELLHEELMQLYRDRQVELQDEAAEGP